MRCWPVALLLAGCGHMTAAHHAGRSGRSQASTAPSVCSLAARDAIAGLLKVAPVRITTRQSTGNNTYPQCSFTARGAGHPSIVALVNDDTGPQPYFVLERTAIEAAQVFTVDRKIPAPQAVTGLGIEADWFPAATQLMATDGVRLITVTVSWRHATQRLMRDLGITITRTYLRQPRRHGASQAKGYPSG